MAIFSGQKRKPIDRRRSLAGIPIINKNVSIRTNEGGTLMLSAVIPRKSRFFSRFLPAVFTRNVKLDELGSFVVNQIDGDKDVLDIIEAFVQEYRTNRRETELSVVAFLKSLVQRQFVSIVVK
jgi:hypothetical protein